MKSKKISVITVVYNGVSTIETTILSVINQNYLNFEYIIIDGKSNDGTIDIIKKYEDKLSYWESESDDGIYDAMNKGINKSTGQWIYFLGSDDVLLNNNVLKDISRKLVNYNTIYYGNSIFSNSGRIYDGKFNVFKITVRNICHQSIFYPHTVFQVLKFNNNYPIYADYDLNLRLFNHKYFTFDFVPLNICLFNENGASGKKIKDYNFDMDFLDIVRKNFPFYVFLYRYLRIIISRIKRIVE